MEHKLVKLFTKIFAVVLLIGAILFCMWRFQMQGLESLSAHFTSRQAAYSLGVLGVVIIVTASVLQALCDRDDGIRYLALVCFMLGTWCYLRSDAVAEKYVHSNIVESVKMTMLLLIAVPVVLFFNEYQEYRYQKAYPAFIMIPFIDWVASMVMLNLLHVQKEDIYLSGHIIVMMIFCACLYYLFLDAFQLKIKSARTILYTMFCMIGCCAFEIAYVYDRHLKWIDQFFGFVIFLGILETFLCSVNNLIQKYRAKEEGILQEERNFFVTKLDVELQKPLKILLENAAEVTEKCMDEELFEKTSKIQFEAENLLQLIQNVTDCVNMYSEKTAYLEEPIQMTELLNHVVSQVFQRAEQKGLEFNVNIEEELPSGFYDDKYCLERILLTLLDNAVRFTDAGEITLQIGWIRLTDDMIKLFATIEDSGIGMEPEVVKQYQYIFEHLEEVGIEDVANVDYGIQAAVMFARRAKCQMSMESTLGKGTKIQISCTRKVFDMTPIGEFQNWYQIQESGIQRFRHRKLQEKEPKDFMTESENEIDRMEEKRKQENTALSVLEHGDIHVKCALKYVGDDFEQYIEIMKMFPARKAEKQDALQQYYKEKDYQNYTILVHALKNNARTLGADTLADLAYEHEKASNRLDGQYIDEHYKELLEEWNRVGELFTTYLQLTDFLSDGEKEEIVQEKQLSQEEWEKQIQQIAEYIDSFKKKEALEILTAMKTYQLQEEQSQIVDKVMEAVKKYDYASAIDILKKVEN